MRLRKPCGHGRHSLAARPPLAAYAIAVSLGCGRGVGTARIRAARSSRSASSAARAAWSNTFGMEVLMCSRSPIVVPLGPGLDDLADRVAEQHEQADEHRCGDPW